MKNLWPFRRCHICGKLHWAGFPQPRFELKKKYYEIEITFGWQWLPDWSEYCSQDCADSDIPF